MLTELGFRPGKVNPCMFMNDERSVRLVVHGDDFTMAGYPEGLDWFRGEIKSRMDLKFRARLGGDLGDDKAVRILNIVVEWSRRGILYEADQRHSEIIAREAGIKDDSKSVGTPGTKIGADDKAKEGFRIGIQIHRSQG